MPPAKPGGRAPRFEPVHLLYAAGAYVAGLLLSRAWSALDIGHWWATLDLPRGITIMLH